MLKMYICIGYMMPTFESYVLQCWKCIFVSDIRCQQFGEYVSVQDICGIGYMCPIQIYIFRIGHSPETLQLTFSPKVLAWYIQYQHIYSTTYILPKLLASYIQCKYTYSKLYIPLPCARRAQRNHPTYIRPQSVGMIYPISTYILKWHILPKLLASYTNIHFQQFNIHISKVRRSILSSKEYNISLIKKFVQRISRSLRSSLKEYLAQISLVQSNSEK